MDKEVENKLKGHPLRHPPVPNTEEWIVGVLEELIENNIPHYKQNIDDMMREIRSVVRKYTTKQPIA